MKTRKLTITLILAAVILAPMALAAAKEDPRGIKKDRGRAPRQKPTNRPAPPTRSSPGRGDLAQMLLGPMGQELKLTDKQQEKIKAIAKDSKATIQGTRKAIQKALKALGEVVEDGTEAKIIAAGKNVGDAFTQQALKKAAATKAIKAELTKEQLLKLEELKAKRKEQMQQRINQRGKAADSKKRDPKAGRKPRTPKTKKTKKPD